MAVCPSGYGDSPKHTAVTSAIRSGAKPSNLQTTAERHDRPVKADDAIEPYRRREAITAAPTGPASSPRAEGTMRIRSASRCWR